MTIDYSAMLYDPVYAEVGVPATLSAGTAGEITLTVIDRTKPKTVANGSAQVQTAEPIAFARVPELVGNGIVSDDYVGAELTFNGRTWTVRSYELEGNPNGEDAGQVRFLLKAANG